MDKNYLILAHDFPEQLLRLVNRLDDSKSQFYIHLDLKSDKQRFTSILKKPNIHFLTNRVNSMWGNFSIVQATLNGINQILKDKRNGVTILMSGQDYPLVNNHEIDTFFAINNGINFINLKPITEAWPEEYMDKMYKYYTHISYKRADGIFISHFLKTPIWLSMKTIFRLIKNGLKRKEFRFFINIFKIFSKRKPPAFLHYGGSQWWVLTIETLKLIQNFILNNPYYIRYHKFTYIPDEIFFHTIVKNLLDNQNEIKIKSSLTYVNWIKWNFKFPAVFEVSDFDELKKAKNQGFLFARKFEAHNDTEILDLLDEHAYLSEKFVKNNGTS